MRLLRPTRSETFIDFGCGADARFCIEAARRYGCRAVGIEIDRGRFRSALQAVVDAGLADRVTILHGDSTKLNVRADVGVAYLYPETLAALRPKIRQLNRFASYSHQVPGLPMNMSGSIWTWQRPSATIATRSPVWHRVVSRPRRVAYWRGQAYTGRVCGNPNCRMCNYIQAITGR